MGKKEFYLLIDEMCEVDDGTFDGSESLVDQEIFDSMAMLGLIALLDEEFSFRIAADELVEAGTLEDLYNKATA